MSDDWYSRMHSSSTESGRNIRVYGKGSNLHLRIDTSSLFRERDDDERFDLENSTRSGPATSRGTTPRETNVSSSRLVPHLGLQNRPHPNIGDEYDRSYEDADESSSLSRKKNKLPTQLQRKISRPRLFSNEADCDTGVENTVPNVTTEPTILAPIQNASTAPSLVNPRALKKISSMRNLNSKCKDNGFKAAIAEGSIPAINILREQVISFITSRICVEFFFRVPIDIPISKSWLEKLGFSEQQPNIYYLVEKSVEELLDAINSVHPQSTTGRRGGDKKTQTFFAADRKLDVNVSGLLSLEPPPPMGVPTPRSQLHIRQSSGTLSTLNFLERSQQQVSSQHSHSNGLFINTAFSNISRGHHTYPKRHDDERTDSPSTEPSTPLSVFGDENSPKSGSSSNASRHVLAKQYRSGNSSNDSRVANPSPLPPNFLSDFSEKNQLGPTSSMEFSSNTLSSATTTAPAMTKSEGFWSPTSEVIEVAASTTNLEVVESPHSGSALLTTDAVLSEVSAVDSAVDDVSAHEEAEAKSDVDKLVLFCTGFLDTADIDANYESDASTQKEQSFTQESTDYFCGSQSLTRTDRGFVISDLKKTNSFADGAIFETDLKDPDDENDGDMWKSLPPRRGALKGCHFMEDAFHFPQDGSAISPQGISSLRNGRHFTEDSYIVGSSTPLNNTTTGGWNFNINGDNNENGSQCRETMRKNSVRASHMKNKNRGLKKQLSESDIHGHSSGTAINLGIITPGGVPSFSQNAAEKPDAPKAVHYQTPQNLRPLITKFELSQEANPLSIEFLTGLINMYCPLVNDGEHSNANFDDVRAVPLERVPCGPIHTIEREGSNLKLSSINSLPFQSSEAGNEERDRFNMNTEDSLKLPTSLLPSSRPLHHSSSTSSLSDLDPSLPFVFNRSRGPQNGACQAIYNPVEVRKSVRNLTLKRSNSLQSFPSFPESTDHSGLMDSVFPMDTSTLSNMSAFGALSHNDDIIGSDIGIFNYEVVPTDDRSRREKKKMMSKSKRRRMSTLNIQPSPSSFILSPCNVINAMDGLRRQSISPFFSGLKPGTNLSFSSNQSDSTPSGRKFSLLKELNHNSIDQNESSLHHNNSRLINMNGSHEENHSGLFRYENESCNQLQSPHSLLEENQFNGVVVGGRYKHCLDGLKPVIAAPHRSSESVVGVYFTINSKALIVRVDCQDDHSVYREVDLSSEWKCIRASPVGFLVTKKTTLPNEKVLCYFMLKHPYDWCTVDNNVNHKNSSTLVRNESDQKNGFGIEIESQPFVVPGYMETIMNENNGNHFDVDVSFVYDHQHFNGNYSVDMHMDIDVPATHASSDSVKHSHSCVYDEVWSNGRIMICIMEYLVNTRELGMTFIRERANSDCSFRPIRKIHTVPAIQPIRRGRSKSGATMTFNSTAYERPPFSSVFNYQTVCKAWTLGIRMLIASKLSNIADPNDQCWDWDKWLRFVTKYPQGEFLGEGACKYVYAVNIPDGQKFAVSVMDVDNLIEGGMGNAIQQELEISMVCSSLVSLNICPNLLLIHSMFQSEYPAPQNLWNHSASISDSHHHNSRFFDPTYTKALPKKSQMNSLKGRYQFICMDFCEGGDVEAIVRKVKQLSIPLVRSFLFQMCFSIYACRDKFSLRHFDIKLLNFLATKGSAVTANNSHMPPTPSALGILSSTIDLQIGFEQSIFTLSIAADANSLIKLADFGTSAIDAKSMGAPINKMQFTTLENTPPEFLLLGSGARQRYSSDTFSLGLCFIHMLTGYDPYEELLKNVQCPEYLYVQLRDIWLAGDEDSPYYVIWQVVQSLVDPVDSESNLGSKNISSKINNPGAVLFDTLYRYMVLFGYFHCEDVVPSDNILIPKTRSNGSSSRNSQITSTSCSGYSSSIIWTVLVDSLGVAMDEDAMNIICDKKNSKSVAAGGRFSAEMLHDMRHMSPSKKDCLKQYQKDLSRWSIHRGDDPKMKSLRSRLNLMGENSMKLLESMVHFDPSKRCSMYEALNSSVFNEFRDNKNNSQSAPQQQQSFPSNSHSHHHNNANARVSFMHYYRPLKQSKTSSSSQSIHEKLQNI